MMLRFTMKDVEAQVKKIVKSIEDRRKKNDDSTDKATNRKIESPRSFVQRKMWELDK